MVEFWVDRQAGTTQAFLFLLLKKFDVLLRTEDKNLIFILILNQRSFFSVLNLKNYLQNETELYFDKTF